MSDGCAKAEDEEMKKRVELERQLGACKRDIENMSKQPKHGKKELSRRKTL